MGVPVRSRGRRPPPVAAAIFDTTEAGVRSRQRWREGAACCHTWSVGSGREQCIQELGWGFPAERFAWAAVEFDGEAASSRFPRPNRKTPGAPERPAPKSPRNVRGSGYRAYVQIHGADERPGTALLLAAAPAGKGALVDTSRVIPALAAVGVGRVDRHRGHHPHRAGRPRRPAGCADSHSGCGRHGGPAHRRARRSVTT